jgi:hypothetical protein
MGVDKIELSCDEGDGDDVNSKTLTENQEEKENERSVRDKKRALSDDDDDDDEEIGDDVGETDAVEISQDNPYRKLRYCIVENDNKPDSCVKLIGLKSLFAKQLPKMPKAYIARLVFDRRHKSLMILNDDPQYKGTDEEIIGAICYRGFYEMRFAEIAFCAVSSSHQVKVR